MAYFQKCFVLALILVVNLAKGQVLSINDLDDIADYVSQTLVGKDLGEGVYLKECNALGRTIVYSYSVPQEWEPIENIREVLLRNLKTSGEAKVYHASEVNVIYNYYKSAVLHTSVKYGYQDFFDQLKLGRHINVKDHPKAKGVELSFRIPAECEVLEGRLPNVVKVFRSDEASLSLVIKENMTFFSRRQALEILKEFEFQSELIEGSVKDFTEMKVLDKAVLDLDTYPAFTFKVAGRYNNVPVIGRFWTIYFEDKIVSFTALSTDEINFVAYEQLYTRIMRSILFTARFS